MFNNALPYCGASYCVLPCDRVVTLLPLWACRGDRGATAVTVLVLVLPTLLVQVVLDVSLGNASNL